MLWKTQVLAIWLSPRPPAGSGHLHDWKPKMSACSQWDCVLSATFHPIYCLLRNLSLLLALPPYYCFVSSAGINPNKEISRLRLLICRWAQHQAVHAAAF